MTTAIKPETKGKLDLEREARRQLVIASYRKPGTPLPETKPEEPETTLQPKASAKRIRECLDFCNGCSFKPGSTDALYQVILFLQDEVSKHPELAEQAKHFVTLVELGV